MFKQLVFFAITSILLGCVKKRDLSVNVVMTQMNASPESLHPITTHSGTQTDIEFYTQRQLIKMDLRDLVFKPDLSINLPTRISNDFYTYQIDLRDDVYWDDGTLFTSDDVLFTTKVTLCSLTNNPDVRGIYTSVFESAETNGKFSFKYTCKVGHRNNKSAYSGLNIIQQNFWDPKGVLDKVSVADVLNPDYEFTKDVEELFNKINDHDYGNDPELLNGLGPYKVESFERGSHVSLKRKEEWWGSNDTSIYNRSYPDKIIFKEISDASAMYLALKNQEIDVTDNISVSKLMKLQKHDYFNDNYESNFVDGLFYFYVAFNMKPDGIKHHALFSDVKVRRALAHLVNVDEIIQVLVKGKGKRQVTNVSPLLKTCNKELKAIPFDVEKAKELLDEAGWIDRDGDNIRENIVNGKTLPFRFKFSFFSYPTTKDLAIMLTENMKKVGIDVELDPLQPNLVFKNLYSHDFDMSMGAWVSDAGYNDPIQLWGTKAWASQGANFTGFGDAESDSLINKANVAETEEEFQEAFNALQKRIYDDQPYIFLYSRKLSKIIHKRFKNRGMYVQSPGFIMNALELDTNFVKTND